MPYKDREKRLQYAKVWNHKHYLEHKDKEKKRIYSRRREISKWFTLNKEKLRCQVCGENTSVCLDFHHLDPKIKDLNLGKIKNWGYSIKRIQSEINKCIILCANCHRKLHAGLITIKE